MCQRRRKRRSGARLVGVEADERTAMGYEAQKQAEAMERERPLAKDPSKASGQTVHVHVQREEKGDFVHS